jgi:hypothetical protein
MDRDFNVQRFFVEYHRDRQVFGDCALSRLRIVVTKEILNIP